MKLTKALKDSIIEIVVNKTFEEREIQLEKERSAIFHKIVEESYPPGFKVTEKTKNWFAPLSRIMLHFEDSKGYTTDTYSITGGPAPVPYYLIKHIYNLSMTVRAKDLSRRLLSEFMAHKEAIRKLKEDEATLEKKMSAMLGQITTVKKLKETWPEVEKYYTFEEPVKNPPAIIINPADINSTIEKMKNAA